VNIQVNAIVPGWIESDMTAAILRPDARSLAPARPRRLGLRKSRPFYDEILKRTPAGRFGTPEECAGAAIFLSAAASDFVTGATIFVDGGYAIK
jgi:2-deoxy-D-gluconate 3-dehydrogenase